MRIYVPVTEATPRFGVYDAIDIVNKVSREKYGGNLVVSSSRQVSDSTVQLLVEVADHGGPGAFLGEVRHHDKGACWHAFQDVLAALYEGYPQARVTTGIARYASQAHFLAVGDTTKPTRTGLCRCQQEVPHEHIA